MRLLKEVKVQLKMAITSILEDQVRNEVHRFICVQNHNNWIRETLTINNGNLTSKGNCSMDPNTLNDVCSDQIDTSKSCKNPTDELAYQTKLIITKNKTKLFHEQNQSSKPSLKVTSCTQYIPVFLSFLLCALR